MQVSRTLADVIADEESVFADLLRAQRELHALNRSGREMSIVNGQPSEVDTVLERLHGAQHRLDALTAEALQAALSGSD
jgi:hypothetical protein